MSSQRAARWWWVAAVAAIAWQCIVVLQRPFPNRFDDLQMYAGSTRGLLDGGSLYDYSFHTGAPFTYPPFGGVVLLFTGAVRSGWLMVGWLVVTLAGVALLAAVLARRSPLAKDPPSPWRTPMILVLLLASTPISSNLRYGQISFFLVALVLVDCLRMVPERYAGVATGIAAAIKLTPLVFIPYYWLSGRRRAAYAATGTFVGCTALAFAALPHDSARFWFSEIFDVSGMGAVAGGGNQSLNAALLRVGMVEHTRSLTVLALGGAVVVAALIRAARAWRASQPLVAATVVGAAGLVLSPVSWMHHQIWLVFAVLLPISARRSANVAWAVSVAIVLVFPVTTIGFQMAGPGGFFVGNAHLVLAVAVAAVVPFVGTGGTGGTAGTSLWSRYVRSRATKRATDPRLTAIETDLSWLG